MLTDFHAKFPFLFIQCGVQSLATPTHRSHAGRTRAQQSTRTRCGQATPPCEPQTTPTNTNTNTTPHHRVLCSGVLRLFFFRCRCFCAAGGARQATRQATTPARVAAEAGGNELPRCHVRGALFYFIIAKVHMGLNSACGGKSANPTTRFKHPNINAHHRCSNFALPLPPPNTTLLALFGNKKTQFNALTNQCTAKQERIGYGSYE